MAKSTIFFMPKPREPPSSQRCCERKKDLNEAKAHLGQSLEGLTRLLGDSDYRKVRCLVALGSTCHYIGELVVAEKHLSLASILDKDVSDAIPYDKIACQEKLADARVGLKK
jgi:hypothetical protein